MIKTSLKDFDVEGKNVLLRADLNIPFHDGKILSDHRLQAIIPTIDFLLKKGAHIILITHRGRPEQPSSSLSTEQLIPWFEKHGYNFTFAPTIKRAQALIKNNHSLILIENLRFFPGEKKHDKEFAQELAALGDFYVNDAFASLHRNDASISLIPKYFPPERRTVGFLVQQELDKLDSLIHSPEKPFALLIGGNKIETKLPLIQNLIDKIDMLFLCPAIVFTFLKALKEPFGKSLTNDKYLDQCNSILDLAQSNNIKIHFPIDYQIAMNNFQGPLSYVPANELPDNAVGINIGPQTVELFAREFKNAKTILYNGLMGDIARPETVDSTCALYNEISQTKANTIIAGGDSVAAAELCNVIDKIDWCSTGGGSVIEYLSGKPLPGIKSLQE